MDSGELQTEHVFRFKAIATVAESYCIYEPRGFQGEARGGQ